MSAVQSVFRRKACAMAMTMTMALALSAPVLAGDTMAGSGNNACDSYLASDDDAKLASESWVLGFLSSANMRARNIDLLANLSNGVIIDALEGYCETHPDATITEAAIDLLKSLVASADGECSGGGAGRLKAGTLSICQTAGSLESNPEPDDFSLIVPGVE